MRGYTQRARARTVGALLTAMMTVSVMSACTGDNSDKESIASKPADGGTVRVLSTQPAFSSLDPQRIFIATESNVSKLITRTLTTFETKPGADGAKLVGDLATDTGTPNSDKTSWKFTLRDGVKWENGNKVTCSDVRYGVLRNFDVRNDNPTIDGGPPYPTEWLKMPKDYRGPKTDGTDDAPGVTCKNERTIVFKLKKPTGNFPSAVAMTAFSPVPESNDTWEDYGDSPVSTGPYKLSNYQPADGKKSGSAVFVRNKNWDKRTDPVRDAKPDKIIFELGVDREYATQQIIAENPEYANAVMYEDVPKNYIQQVINNNTLAKQTLSGATPAVTYVAINSRTVKKRDCRKALVYGFNKSKFLDVIGGQVSGDYATTMIPPGDPAHTDSDVYGLANKPQGDLDKAKELLDDAGDCPHELTLDVADAENSKQYADSIITTYGRLGIKVKKNELDPEAFYDELTYPDKQHDLVISSWLPDWPGGSGVIPPLFNGDSIKDGLNSNFSLLDDDDINAKIKKATKESDPKAASKLWADLDTAIQRQAAVVPIAFSKANSLCGKDVRGAFLNTQWGAVDLASLGVADGS